MHHACSVVHCAVRVPEGMIWNILIEGLESYSHTAFFFKWRAVSHVVTCMIADIWAIAAIWSWLYVHRWVFYGLFTYFHLAGIMGILQTQPKDAPLVGPVVPSFGDLCSWIWDIPDTPMTYWCVLRRVAGWVAGWVAGGCWDDDITSDDWDHSRKFPAFSTSKMKLSLKTSEISHPSFIWNTPCLLVPNIWFHPLLTRVKKGVFHLGFGNLRIDLNPNLLVYCITLHYIIFNPSGYLT